MALVTTVKRYLINKTLAKGYITWKMLRTTALNNTKRQQLVRIFDLKQLLEKAW